MTHEEVRTEVSRICAEYGVVLKELWDVHAVSSEESKPVSEEVIVVLPEEAHHLGKERLKNLSNALMEVEGVTRVTVEFDTKVQ